MVSSIDLDISVGL